LGLTCSLSLKTPGTNGLSRSHEGAADARRTRPSLRPKGLACARVLIVVPYADDDPAGASVSVAELVAVLDDVAGE
jgi:hypothetical protein